jgi:hypothetical protein
LIVAFYYRLSFILGVEVDVVVTLGNELVGEEVVVVGLAVDVRILPRGRRLVVVGLMVVVVVELVGFGMVVVDVSR